MKQIHVGVVVAVGVVMLGGSVQARHQKIREPQQKSRDRHPNHYEKKKRKEGVEAGGKMLIEKQYENKLKNIDAREKKEIEKCAGDQTCIDRSQEFYDQQKAQSQKNFDQQKAQIKKERSNATERQELGAPSE